MPRLRTLVRNLRIIWSYKITNSSQYSAAGVECSHTRPAGRVGRRGPEKKRVAAHSQLNGTTPSLPHRGLWDANTLRPGPGQECKALHQEALHCRGKSITQHLIIYSSHPHCLSLLKVLERSVCTRLRLGQKKTEGQTDWEYTHSILGNSTDVCWSFRSVASTNYPCFLSDDGVNRDHLWNHLCGLFTSQMWERCRISNTHHYYIL